MANVLIIDDNESMSRMLMDLVMAAGHDSEYSLTFKTGMEKVLTGCFDVVFLDVQLPDGDGLSALKEIREMASPPEVVVITGDGDPDGAEIAIKNGAWDYLQKPCAPQDIILPLKRVLQYRENLEKKQPSAVILKRNEIIGNSLIIKRCLDQLAHAAGSDANVLITGETGTGKEVFAKALYANSDRTNNNFVVVDCAALPETLVESQLFGYEKGAFTGADRSKNGLIRQADQGVLFLDEVCELSLPLQKAFLRVLQERRYRPIGAAKELQSNFRLVSATNRDPDKMVAAGLFRKDLLYRLRSISIKLPPLSERHEDIREMAIYYIEQICSRMGMKPKGFSPDLMDMLSSYNWPGNVREMINTLESAITSAEHEPILFPKHLPNRIRIHTARASVETINGFEGDVVPEPGDLHVEKEEEPDDAPLPYKMFRESVLAEAEKKYLKQLMAYTRGSIKDACRIANLGRTRLYTLMKKHDVSRRDY